MYSFEIPLVLWWTRKYWDTSDKKKKLNGEWNDSYALVVHWRLMKHSAHILGGKGEDSDL